MCALPTATISVLLLYVSPLLGEGLERLLAAEAGLSVTALPLVCAAAAPTAIEPDADVVIFEEGGPFGLEQLLERIQSPVVIVISLHTDKVRTLRLDDLRTRQGDVIDSIVATCLERPGVAVRVVGAGSSAAAGEPAF